MSKLTKVLLVAGLVSAIPAGAYAWALWNDDTSPLASYLNSYGFVAIVPPSTLVDLGSLYYVDWNSKLIGRICRANGDDVTPLIQRSPGETGVGRYLVNQKFTVDISLPSDSASTDLQIENRRTITLSLSDVNFDEITLEQNRTIADKLMAREQCKRAVLEVFQTSGYVCQGRLVLSASAKYDFSSTNQNEIAGRLKKAIEEQTDTSLTGGQDGIWSGQSLEYGIQMDRFCLTPDNAYFKRMLPKNAFDQLVNYMKYNILEPILVRI